MAQKRASGCIKLGDDGRVLILMHHDGYRRVEALCEALRTAQCNVVLVSNEVGSGVVPEYAVGCRYRDLLGEINQKVARVADDVVLLVAGLPLALKGHVEVMQ